MEAVRHGSADVARWLEQTHPESKKARNIGHLICAASSKGDLQTLQKYHECGVNVSAIMDYDKRTALHLAACEGHFHVVDWLVNVIRVDVNKKDRWEETPLDNARRRGRLGISEMLLKKSRGVETLSER